MESKKTFTLAESVETVESAENGYTVIPGNTLSVIKQSTLDSANLPGFAYSALSRVVGRGESLADSFRDGFNSLKSESTANNAEMGYLLYKFSDELCKTLKVKSRKDFFLSNTGLSTTAFAVFKFYADVVMDKIEKGEITPQFAGISPYTLYELRSAVPVICDENFVQIAGFSQKQAREYAKAYLDAKNADKADGENADGNTDADKADGNTGGKIELVSRNIVLIRYSDFMVHVHEKFETAAAKITGTNGFTLLSKGTTPTGIIRVFLYHDFYPVILESKSISVRRITDAEKAESIEKAVTDFNSGKINAGQLTDRIAQAGNDDLKLANRISLNYGGETSIETVLETVTGWYKGVEEQETQN